MQETRGHLFKMAVPLIIGSLLEPISSVIDNAFVGRLDTNWLGALAFGTILLSSFSWVFNFIIHVTTESMSKVFGDGESKDLVGTTQVSLLVSLLVGLLTIIFLYLFQAPLFSLVGVRPELLEVTKSYFFTRLIGHPFLVLFLTTISLLRGISQVKATMFLLLLSTVINSGLNYLFLYHYRLGPEYAAWGTNISVIICFFIALAFHLNKIGERSLFRVRSFSAGDLLQFSSKSGNLFLRSLSLTSIFFISTRLAGRISTIDLAAHQVLLQFWLFSSFFIDGVAVVANIYVSRWSGRGATEKTRWAIRECFYQGLAFGLLFTTIYFFAQGYFVPIFSKDLKVISKINELWPLIVWSQVINALAFVIDGVLFGAREYRYLRNMMLFIFLAVFLPFAVLAHSTSQIIYLWSGLVAVSFARLLIGGFKVNKIH